MGRYILGRLAALIPVLLGVSILVFSMIRLIPGDAVLIMLGTNIDITPERVAHLREQLGLNLPSYEQYLRWLMNVLRGDLGISVTTGQPVLSEILQRVPVTVELALGAVLIAVLLSIPLGLLAAAKKNGITDVASRFVSFIGLAVPNFWFGTLLLLAVSVYFQRFPTTGYYGLAENPVANVLRFAPAWVTLAFPMAAALVRMMRSSSIDVLSEPYVQTARAKGLRERVVLLKHVLKNAFIPTLTIIGIQAGHLLGGAIVVEEVFALPGLGRLVVGSILDRNYPLIQGIVLVITSWFVIINLAVDLLYSYLNPKIRY